MDHQRSPFQENRIYTLLPLIDSSRLLLESGKGMAIRSASFNVSQAYCLDIGNIFQIIQGDYDEAAYAAVSR